MSTAYSSLTGRYLSENIAVNTPMKNILLVPLVIVVACILMAGCVGQIRNTTVNNSNVSPTNTFTPFTNSTNVSTISNTSNITVTSGLKGPLRVTIGGWEADLPVYIDNQSVGIASHNKPLDLMVEEGNHTVKICAGTLCNEEVVTVRFAKPRIVDFEPWLVDVVQFPKPTAQIVGWYPSGDQITVSVEFINPSTKDLQMSAKVTCSYTYIESRSNNRIGSVGQGLVNANVKSGARAMQNVNLNLASGYSFVYSIPEISSITYR